MYLYPRKVYRVRPKDPFTWRKISRYFAPNLIISENDAWLGDAALTFVLTGCDRPKFQHVNDSEHRRSCVAQCGVGDQHRAPSLNPNDHVRDELEQQQNARSSHPNVRAPIHTVMPPSQVESLRQKDWGVPLTANHGILSSLYFTFSFAHLWNTRTLNRPHNGLMACKITLLFLCASCWLSSRYNNNSDTHTDTHRALNATHTHSHECINTTCKS